MVDEEAGGKVALEHTATKGIHGKAAAGTGNHKFHPLGNVKACFLRKEEGFAGADHHASNGGLIGKLALLAKASAAAVQNVGAHLVEAGQYALVSCVVAAHKDGELGIARAHVAAGNRGVQRFAALLFGGSGNALGQHGAGGAHVAHNAASGQAAQHAVFAQRHFFHIVGIAHNGKDHVRGFGHGAGGIGPLGAFGE